MTTVTVVTDTNGDEARRRGLRQMRAVALGLLLFAALVYVLTLGRDGVWGFVNAGAEASIVAGKILENKGATYGYNAQTGEYGDMVAMGVLDPTKVTRTALQNAASIASLMLTTDCMVADLPDDRQSAPMGGGDMGGMGGMGGMGMM